MTSHLHPHEDSRRARPWVAARVACWLVAGMILAQLAGCAARFWPPSAWSLSVDLPYARPEPADPAPAPRPPVAQGPLQDPTSASEALAYAEALCALPPAELAAEIERLETINTQDGHTPLRAQQLAFAQRLAQLYAEQERLQESNERQTQLLRERQRHIEQLNGQIEAMRAVEYSLPAANTSAVPTPATTTNPVAPLPASAGRPGGAPVSSSRATAPITTSPPATAPGKSPATGNGVRGNGDTAPRSADEQGNAPKVDDDTPSPANH
jgi:TolA-binding protein